MRPHLRLDRNRGPARGSPCCVPMAGCWRKNASRQAQPIRPSRTNPKAPISRSPRSRRNGEKRSMPGHKTSFQPEPAGPCLWTPLLRIFQETHSPFPGPISMPRPNCQLRQVVRFPERVGIWEERFSAAPLALRPGRDQPQSRGIHLCDRTRIALTPSRTNPLRTNLSKVLDQPKLSTLQREALPRGPPPRVAVRRLRSTGLYTQHPPDHPSQHRSIPAFHREGPWSPPPH